MPSKFLTSLPRFGSGWFANLFLNATKLNPNGQLLRENLCFLFAHPKGRRASLRNPLFRGRDRPHHVPVAWGDFRQPRAFGVPPFERDLFLLTLVLNHICPVGEILQLMLRRRSWAKIKPDTVFPLIGSDVQHLLTARVHSDVGLAATNEFARFQDAQRIRQICKEVNPMFLARYAEMAGSGILDMIA
jgi:hypothetical protein